LGEHETQSFLRRRLADRPGHRGDAGADLAPRGRAKTFKRGKNVRYDIERTERRSASAWASSTTAAMAPFFEGGADIIMAVRIESFDGEK